MRVCTSGKVSSCNHTADQVLNYAGSSAIKVKLNGLCKNKFCQGQEKVVGDKLDAARIKSTVVLSKEEANAEEKVDILAAVLAGLDFISGDIDTEGEEEEEEAPAKENEKAKKFIDNFDYKTLDATDVGELKKAVKEGDMKSVKIATNDKLGRAKSLVTMVKRKKQAVESAFAKAKDSVKMSLKNPEKQAKLVTALSSFTNGLSIFMSVKKPDGSVDPLKATEGVLNVVSGISELLPAPASMVTGLISSVFNLFTGGGGPSTEQVIKDEFKKQKEFIEKEFEKQRNFMEKLWTKTELESFKIKALGIMDSLESRYEFISAYEDIDSCLEDNVVAEITQRVEYFLDQSDAYAVKHAFDTKCPAELTKVDALESQKACSFLIDTYLTIEEKQQEILTIMLSLLFNSENYEELTNGYLKVQAEKKKTLRQWLSKTFKVPDTYCGLFVFHKDVWGSDERMKHVKNIIFHYSPEVKDMDNNCLLTSKWQPEKSI